MLSGLRRPLFRSNFDELAVTFCRLTTNLSGETLFGSQLMDANVGMKTVTVTYRQTAFTLHGGRKGGQESSRPMLRAVISQLSARRIKLISSADVTTAVRRQPWS